MNRSSTTSGCASWRLLAASVAVPLALAAGCRVQPETREREAIPAAPQEAPPTSPVGLPRSFADIAARVNPSVVWVATKQVVSQRNPHLPPLGMLGVPLQEQIMVGTGSGFVIDTDGYVLTNAHVIGEASDLRVLLADGRRMPATVVGLDHLTDVALLRVEASNLVPVVFGDSDAIAVGDWVVAIGNPYGLSHTVTAGIVGAKGRTSEDVQLDPFGLYDFLQTDAAINQGNSGGPLLDVRGEVVGINTAIHSTGQGLGFAIPINMVKGILPQLRTRGRFDRAWIGVQIGDVPADPQVLERLHLPAPRGALVGQVVPGGPAAAAGIRADDVILAFNGQPIERWRELLARAGTASVGSRVRLRIWRDGEAIEIPVVLGPMPRVQ